MNWFFCSYHPRPISCYIVSVSFVYFWTLVYVELLFFFFFKQKTAYESRISDWSSDVCSSDLTDNGNTGYFLPNRDGYNQRTGRSLILARKRYLGAAKVDYEFSDRLEGFAQVQYSRITSGETREAVGIGWDSTFPLSDPDTGITQESEYGKMPCRPVSGRTEEETSERQTQMST